MSEGNFKIECPKVDDIMHNRVTYERNDFEKIAYSIAQVLTEKNKRYGNSALEPLNIFSRLDAGSSIYVRLDDKLGRIRNAEKLRKNDVADLIGYLFLECKRQGWLDFSDQID